MLSLCVWRPTQTLTPIKLTADDLNAAKQISELFVSIDAHFFHCCVELHCQIRPNGFTQIHVFCLQQSAEWQAHSEHFAEYMNGKELNKPC
jgi:hypothetical protein